MNLNELAKKDTATNYANTYKAQFGVDINLDELTLKETSKLLSKTIKLINEYRHSHKFHTSQNNSSYMQMLMLEETLTAKALELNEAGDPGSFGGNNTNTGKSMKPIIPGQMSGEYANALKKTAMGEDISAKEYKKLKKRGISESLLTVLDSKDTARAFMRKIIESKRVLKEDEVSSAQVVLAAQDMVDRIQKMAEDMVDLQYKDVPALADTMKTEIGVDEATQFKDTMSAALQTLSDTLSSTKEQMDGAVAIVTGEGGPVDPMGDLAGVDAGMPPMDDMGMDMGGDLDGDGIPDDAPIEEPIPVPGDDVELGRERR
jgi:hypothetical protein